jgi:hypothetical protein
MLRTTSLMTAFLLVASCYCSYYSLGALALIGKQSPKPLPATLVRGPATFAVLGGKYGIGK